MNSVDRYILDISAVDWNILSVSAFSICLYKVDSKFWDKIILSYFEVVLWTLAAIRVQFTAHCDSVFVESLCYMSKEQQL